MIVGRAALAAVALSVVCGCASTTVGIQYLPERVHYDMFDEFEIGKARLLRRVHETAWGVDWFGFQLKRVSARAIVDRATGENPNYYVANLSVHTYSHGTLFIPFGYIFMNLPKVTVDFDLVEVTPPAGTGSPP